MYCVQLPDNFQMREHSWPCRFYIKRNGIFFIIEAYCYNGVFFINDIISEDKQSYQQFQNKYMIGTHFLEYYGIVGAVPKRWKKTLFQSMGGCMILKMTLLTD